MKEEVAKAIRVEYDHENDKVYVVFLISDEKLKQEIRKDWLQDIKFNLAGKHLVYDII